MDNLKKYLQQHLDELDIDQPGDEVWQRIQKEATLVIPKRNVVQLVTRYAAAACVLLCIAAGAYLIGRKQTAPETAIHTSNDSGKLSETIAVVQPDNMDSTLKRNLPNVVKSTTGLKEDSSQVYVKEQKPVKKSIIQKRKIIIDPSQLMVQEIDNNYSQLVNMQLQQLQITPVYAESPDYFSTFKQQFKQIENDEAAIKKDIRRHGLTDELLQQLININQQKLNVLTDLRAEISKLNNKVRQPQNWQDSSLSFYLNM